MNKFLPGNELTKKVLSLVSQGEKPKQIKKFISAQTGFRKTKAGEMYREIIAGVSSDVREEQPERLENVSIQSNEKYTYNSELDNYVVALKSAGRDIVIPGHVHRAMLNAYSNWDGKPQTLNMLSRMFELPKPWLKEYMTIMGWTHDHEPVSKEVLLDSETGAVVEDIFQKKRASLFQEFQKQDWKYTQVDADKWRQFRAKQVDPFEEALKNWTPPKYKGLPEYKFKGKKCGDEIFVISCFDFHIGAEADKRYLFKGEDWNCAKASQSIDQYILDVIKIVEERNNHFKEAVILMGGDLFHGMRGMTEKGTLLECDKIRDDQFDAVFNGLHHLISRFSEVFPKLKIKIVRGNHDGFDTYPLSKALEAYFRTEKRIEFEIFSSRTALFRIGPVLTLMDHGDSDTFSSPVPRSGKARESYIQSLLLAHPEHLIGVKQKIFICGNLHRFQQMECNDFEYIMSGAMPLGDKYADHLNLHSRPRQNCLIINDNGLKETIHVYLD